MCLNTLLLRVTREDQYHSRVCKLWFYGGKGYVGLAMEMEKANKRISQNDKLFVKVTGSIRHVLILQSVSLKWS